VPRLLIRAFFFGPVYPLLALPHLPHWPDFGGMTAGSSDSDTSGEISQKTKALLLIEPCHSSACAVKAQWWSHP